MTPSAKPPAGAFRPFLWAIVLVAMLFAAGVGGAAWIIAPEAQEPAAPDYPRPATAGEGVRQDLNHLREVAEVDRSFTPAGRAEFARRLAVLEASSERMDPAALQMGVAWALAAADNGHTAARSAIRGRDVNALPLRVLWFRDGLHVVKADPGHAGLLGARVLEIDGHPVEAIRAELGRYMGGRRTLLKPHSTYAMASPQVLHAIGLGAAPARSTLTLQLPDGGLVSQTIVASDRPIVLGEDDIPASRDLSPAPWPGDPRAWRHVLPPDRAPVYLRRPDEPYWRDVLPGGALYIQIDRTRNVGGTTLPRFLSGALRDIKARPPASVIVDLRHNSGGDSTLTSDFARRLTEVLPADRKVYVLVGPGTFSAAITTLARLRMFGGDRVHVIGEPVGDRPSYWGEGGTAVLPNSRIRVRYSTGLHHHDRACRPEEFRTCYWMDFFWKSIAPIDPDLTIEPTFAEYLAGRDPVLEAARAMVDAASAAPSLPASR